MATFYEIKTPDAAEPPPDDQALPAGVRAACLVLVGLALAIAAPYAVVAATGEPVDETGTLATVAGLRAWVPGDAPPFSRSFRTTGAGPAVAEAGMSRLAAAGVPAEAAGALAELAAAADEDDPAGEESPIPLLVQPHPSDPAEPDRDPDAVDPDAADPDPDPADPGAEPAPPPDPFARIRVPAELYEGVTAEIEDPSGSMDAFYEALARTALGEPGAVTRVTQWGDSAIAADGMTSAARRLMQRQFGDAGHGFSLVAAGNPWYLRKDVTWKSTGWRTQEFIRRQADDGRYGYGGVGAVGFLGAHATWSTVEEGDGPVGRAASRFEVYYAAAPRAGRLEVQVDGEPKVEIDTAEDEAADRVHVVEVEDGPHTFRIRNVGGGQTRVYGVVLERAGPGVVYDGIGVVGARAARQLFADEAHFHGQLQARKPDLMILMYGGNEIPDKTRPDVYKQGYVDVIGRFRAGRPEASCVVMSPLDHGERHRGRVRTVPRMYDLMELQREAALESGCAWYSLFDAMGGEGSIGAWYDSGLAASDLAHPTARGSRALGALWYKSLVKGFADWLDRRRGGDDADADAPPGSPPGPEDVPR